MSVEEKEKEILEYTNAAFRVFIIRPFKFLLSLCLLAALAIAVIAAGFWIYEGLRWFFYDYAPEQTGITGGRLVFYATMGPVLFVYLLRALSWVAKSLRQSG